ncbi:hypothetical protein DSY2168 [Desulfitobacterium hafniense Y51]|uniref:Uncharacterized protein n=1 Tax=Desulfitobacterium hafniense (strain Y51) TaxID=138119 RepID=Q24VI5_DESHY|nr:hypothetical protein DSY2168 [Desulfitobacterium hafniense Y51]
MRFWTNKKAPPIPSGTEGALSCLQIVQRIFSAVTSANHRNIFCIFSFSFCRRHDIIMRRAGNKGDQKSVNDGQSDSLRGYGTLDENKP